MVFPSFSAEVFARADDGVASDTVGLEPVQNPSVEEYIIFNDNDDDRTIVSKEEMKILHFWENTSTVKIALHFVLFF